LPGESRLLREPDQSAATFPADAWDTRGFRTHRRGQKAPGSSDDRGLIALGVAELHEADCLRVRPSPELSKTIRPAEFLPRAC